MCCDLCDHYYSCEEVEKMKTACCTKCEEFEDCHGEVKAARRAGEEVEEDEGVEEDPGVLQPAAAAGHPGPGILSG